MNEFFLSASSGRGVPCLYFLNVPVVLVEGRRQNERACRIEVRNLKLWSVLSKHKCKEIRRMASRSSRIFPERDSCSRRATVC
jgi:hypothetical protein